MARRRSAALVLASVLVVASAVEAGPRSSPDPAETLVQAVREHARALEAGLPRREADLQAALASLDRSSVLFARGRITREELARAARDVTVARALRDETQRELLRAAPVVAEIEARRRLARLPALARGTYDVRGGLVRYAGTRGFAAVERRALERYVAARIGRSLPVSAEGQSEFHTRIGLDHRHAVDLALHPDSVEGRLVMAWLRGQDIPFMAFRGALSGAASGAHIHVGPPSGRLALPVRSVAR